MKKKLRYTEANNIYENGLPWLKKLSHENKTIYSEYNITKEVIFWV